MIKRAIASALVVYVLASSSGCCLVHRLYYGGCGTHGCGGCGHCGTGAGETFCGGCGETYWGDWCSHPPDCCDPCDCCGNYTGHGGPSIDYQMSPGGMHGVVEGEVMMPHESHEHQQVSRPRYKARPVSYNVARKPATARKAANCPTCGKH